MHALKRSRAAINVEIDSMQGNSTKLTKGSENYISSGRV